MTELLFILGTRPEIVKMSPLVRKCQSLKIDYEIIHTGQHYSEKLSSVFFDQLALPDPDYNLDIRSGSHGYQTGKMMIEIGEIIAQTNPERVLVQGDTNTVLAASLIVSKMVPTLGHVEAGLRSYNFKMPEEINRIVSDHVSDYLFAPTNKSVDQLRSEGIPEERIYKTGNTIVEATRQNTKLAESASNILEELDLKSEEYCLFTAHRAENVDSQSVFESILSGVARFSAKHALPIVFPAHPRSRRRIYEFDITIPDEIMVVDPQNYFDFLKLERNASIIFTDSGGVQEEACILGIPCVTTRTETERPETVSVGANAISGVTADEIVLEGNRMITVSHDWAIPLGDGHASEYILDILALT